MEGHALWLAMQSERTLYAVALFAIAAVMGGRLLKGRSSEVHKRGVVLEERDRRQPVRRPAPARCGTLVLAGQELPFIDETKHFKIIGTT